MHQLLQSHGPRTFGPLTRPHRRALACAAALAFGSAHAAEFNWTAGAGSAASFWDLADNWTPGLPSGTDARLNLGAYHTTLRSGVFNIGSVQGTGTVLFSGGELRLNGAPSALGALRMAGGKLYGPSTLTVRDFHWESGGIAPLDPLNDPSSRLIVTGNTTFGNGGNKYMGYRSTLELQGRTRWLDGASTVTLDGNLQLGSGARFDDRAQAADHHLHLGGAFTNAGVYAKTGQGKSSFSMPYGGASFDNTGRFLVQEGAVSISGAPSGSWRNAGTLEVHRGAALSVNVFRYPAIEQSGTVRVDGQASFSVNWSGMHSTGEWVVGRTGSLVFVNDQFDDRSVPITFTAGTLRNDGSLLLDGGETHFRGGAILAGRGTVELRQAAVLASDSAINVGVLRAGGLYEFPGGPGAWGSVSAPDIQVTELDWGVSDLRVPGRVSVAGTAKLHGGPQYFTGDGSGPDTPGYRKVVDGWLALGGITTWSGETDLVGSGRISVAARRIFNDQTAAGLPTGLGDDRPVQLGVARFDNHGTYMKTGAGATEATGAFHNLGTVRTEGRGQLIFSGTLDNRGTLEARGARIDVRGALSQWSLAERRLTGGAYIANGNVIAVDLGSEAGIARNSARIELRGVSARLLNRHGGADRDALASLSLNDNSLRLIAGAGVATSAALTNRGSVVVGEDSVLDVAGLYRQTGDTSETWISGALRAGSIDFAGGFWGAGLGGTVGTASLTGSEVRLGGGRLDVDIAGASSYDVVSIAGRAFLGGTLFAQFADTSLAEGLYRVLTATSGLDGSFSVLTNLDPAQYNVSLIYGATQVDLQVTRVAGGIGIPASTPPLAVDLPAAPVPEPETYALMLAGLAVLLARKRRQAR